MDVTLPQRGVAAPNSEHLARTINYIMYTYCMTNRTEEGSS